MDINYQSVTFDAEGPVVLDTDGWVLLAWHKATGNHPIGMSRVPITTGTASTVSALRASRRCPPPARVASSCIGNNPFSEPFDGQIAGVGLFPTKLTDATIEGLVANWDAWETAGASHLWVLDQAATSTAVVDSVSGGGADQTSLTGTSVVSGVAPIEWAPVAGLANFRLTESGGLRGMEATTNLATEDYANGGA